MNLIDKIFKTGELPKVQTEVTIPNRTLIVVAFTVVVISTIVILINRIAKKL